MASAIFSFSSSRVSPCEIASGTCSHWPVYQPLGFLYMIIVYSIVSSNQCLYFILQNYKLFPIWQKIFHFVSRRRSAAAGRLSRLLPAHGLRRGSSVFSRRRRATAYHILPPPASHPAGPFLYRSYIVLISFLYKNIRTI